MAQKMANYSGLYYGVKTGPTRYTLLNSSTMADSLSSLMRLPTNKG